MLYFLLNKAHNSYWIDLRLFSSPNQKTFLLPLITALDSVNWYAGLLSSMNISGMLGSLMVTVPYLSVVSVMPCIFSVILPKIEALLNWTPTKAHNNTNEKTLFLAIVRCDCPNESSLIFIHAIKSRASTRCDPTTYLIKIVRRWYGLFHCNCLSHWKNIAKSKTF